MKYALLANESPEDFVDRDAPETADAYRASWYGYVAALQESGILDAAEGLLPPTTATTVRARGGTPDVQDGPFADAKEALGGVFFIDVPDLDTAVEWAARCPAAARGSVEIRPLMPRMS